MWGGGVWGGCMNGTRNERNHLPQNVPRAMAYFAIGVCSAVLASSVRVLTLLRLVTVLRETRTDLETDVVYGAV